LADGLQKVLDSGFQAQDYGEHELSEEEIRESYRELGRLTGLRAVRHTIHGMCLRATVGLKEFPHRFRDDRLDGLIVDQIVAEAAAVAQQVNLPYVTVCNALPVNLTPDVPPVFSRAMPGRGPWSTIRNRLLNALANRLAQPLMSELNRFQRDHHLPEFNRSEQLRSKLAQISQIPRSFDFPRKQTAISAHYTGPFHDRDVRARVDFPWNRLDSRLPLIYASMGTLQNRIRFVFRSIAEACRTLPVQLVISLGGGAQPSEFADLPGDPIVVRYAPQLDLLDRAALCVTHAGLNTALESMSRGVPMLAIPITNDQPGVAARIQWCGLGRIVPLGRLSANALRHQIQLMLSDDECRQNAKAMQREIELIDGPVMASEIIERAITTQRPVGPIP
ncbi:MAG: nucleotide disphospho-sugar-binding domain-containing protein, partial [Planctomycetota bacterium]